MTKKKKKESWKEKRRRAAIKRQKALEAERLRREREPKKSKGLSKGKIFGVAFMFLLIIGIYGVWQYTQPSPNNNPNVNKQKAPLFTLADIDGNVVKLENLTGKVVVLDIFQINCPGCTQEDLELKKIYDKYDSSEVVILSISVGFYDTNELLREYRDNHQIPWTVAKDTDDVSEKYEIEFTPTVLIIKQDGTTYYRSGGSTLPDASLLSGKIDSLLSH